MLSSRQVTYDCCGTSTAPNQIAYSCRILAYWSVLTFSAFGCGGSEERLPEQLDDSTITILASDEFYSTRLGELKYLLYLPLVDRYGPEMRPRLADRLSG